MIIRFNCIIIVCIVIICCLFIDYTLFYCNINCIINNNSNRNTYNNSIGNIDIYLNCDCSFVISIKYEYLTISNNSNNDKCL
jgi:hypothetical protein